MNAAVQGDLTELLASVGNHPRKDEERERIDAAILDDGRQHGGWIHSGRVREALSNQYGINVDTHLLATRYRILRGANVIWRPEDWDERSEWKFKSTDTRGRNAGRLMPMYRVVGA